MLLPLLLALAAQPAQAAGEPRTVALLVSPATLTLPRAELTADVRITGNTSVAGILGVDLLLVETFPHLGEGLAAVEEALATGATVWASFTPGPEGDLLSPAEVAEGARLAAGLGAHAVLVNCLPASRAMEWLRPLLDLGLAVPVGLYANAGHPTEGLGWQADPTMAAQRYADLAEAWVEAGATIIGSCCGTGPETIEALARRFGE